MEARHLLPRLHVGVMPEDMNCLRVEDGRRQTMIFFVERRFALS